MVLVKSLEESGSLVKGVSQLIKNEAKEQRRAFLEMLLDTVGASLLWNLLTCKGAIATSHGRKRSETLAKQANMLGKGRVGAEEGTIKAGQDF